MKMNVDEWNGKLTVYVEYFNGSILNCTTNADCFPENAGVCTGNLTGNTDTIWGQSYMCVCPLYRGYKSATCNGEQLFEFSEILRGFFWLACVLSLISLIYGIHLLYRQGNRKFGSAAQTTAVCATIASFWGMMFFLEILVCYYTSSKVCEGTPSFRTFQTCTYCLFFFFITVSTLNISLMWIEVAERSQKMTNQAVLNVTKYRKVLYLYGYYRMKKLLSTGTDRYKTILRPMSIATMGVALSAQGSIITAIILGVVTSRGGWKKVTPLYNEVAILYYFYFGFGMLANVAVLYYCGSNLSRGSNSADNSKLTSIVSSPQGSKGKVGNYAPNNEAFQQNSTHSGHQVQTLS
jgi:hypothetical protein